jgi:hypothetical protein
MGLVTGRTAQKIWKNRTNGTLDGAFRRAHQILGALRTDPFFEVYDFW